MHAKILLVDDEDLLRWSVKGELEDAGYEVLEADCGKKALQLFQEEGPALMLLDIKLPDMNGIEVLHKLKERAPEVPVIMITAHGSIDTALEAMKGGALDYISKPFDYRELLLVIEKALETSRLQMEVKRLREEHKKRNGFENIIGISPKMQQVFEIMRKVSDSEATTVLLQGDSGVGKGMIARAIHYSSRRADRPFMEIDCASLPEHLIESELFGHERGAFTDAKMLKRGLFEMAQGGTIFLDEIGELSFAMQAKLLRAIENRTFKRVGGVVDLNVDARIVAATNRDLKEEVAKGNFREDLYFRLKVIPIYVPPLRERREDIPVLVRHFIEKFNKEYRKRVKGISPAAERLLIDYSWPGNVRELKNVIERIVILEADEVILEEHLPPEISMRSQQPKPSKRYTYEIPPEGINLDEVERQFLEQSLMMTNGNQSRAAKLLGITRHQLRYRMGKFGLL